MRALAAALLALITLPITPASAAGDLEETARAALVAFTEAVIAGPEAAAKVLAPEYQILRANGVGYDREGYIEEGVGRVNARPDFAYEEIVATADGDILVVRSMLRIEETIDGAPVDRRAPRLTVFRKIDGAWKVVAHANFGATAPAQ